MSLKDLLVRIEKDQQFLNLLKELKRPPYINSVSLRSSIRPFVLSAIADMLHAPVLIITSRPGETEDLYENISAFLKERAFLFPGLDVIPGEDIGPDKVIVGQRSNIVDLLYSSHPMAVILSQTTFEEGVGFLKVEDFKPLTIREGKEIDFDMLLKGLVGLGYERVYMVEKKGEFSVRGGIVDIYPVTDDEPVRLELLGDTVEQMKTFSLVTQRSVKKITTATIYNTVETHRKGRTKTLADFLPQEGRIILDASGTGGEETPFFKPRPHPVFTKAGSLTDFEFLKKHLRHLDEEGFKTTLALDGKGQVERFSELIREWGITSSRIDLTDTVLQDGFILDEIKTAVMTDRDIFGLHRKKRQLKQSGRKTFFDLMDIKDGDLLVHIYHGIGVYRGLTQKEVDGIKRDYLVIEYAEGDKLYLPSDQMNLVQRYIGGEGVKPSIYRLGGRRWQSVKRKVKESAEVLAASLLELYAERKKAEGFAFSPDTPWQRELEDSFPYQETPDQAVSILDIKRDMEEIAPMDRLVCGDVGYGKTEVAIRAAFKAVMDGKQVAVLVPTTILADQHYLTFKERFQAFPIRLEVVSRLKTEKEQKVILEDAESGRVDVLIGTHRLLQPDIRFKDLGLIIVDEEQRFGVKHKEHLKELRKDVDVLSLSATPIPRTLNMAITGIRDMSIIDTPPEDRYPVSTYVGEYSDAIVANAIKRELSRGGQVFFVHNQIYSIGMFVEKLAELVPEARIALAHGRMPEKALEKVMMGFYAHQFDVLASTTIIESGLDVPNANTLIVDRSDKMGLAQLYQLRGRVGRADRRAFAYFLYAPGTVLSDTAFHRLETIAEMTELGSGFRIALRDLEIRGAGNILGKEQHGFVNDVGFELYADLLKEAVARLQGRPLPKRTDARINLPVDAYIAKDYIGDEALRVDAYKRISATSKKREVKDIADELEDRYGPLPDATRNLLDIAILKVVAIRLGINRISYEAGRIRLAPCRLSDRRAGKISEEYTGTRYRKEEHALYVKAAPSAQIVSLLTQMLCDIMT
jgi:transcription-repair coupling factor (superfamily II helicase)